MYLFVIYGLFILLLLGIFFFFTYTHYRKNAVETQLNNISTISMNIVYSNAVKSNFKEFSASYRRNGPAPSGGLP